MSKSRIRKNRLAMLLSLFDDGSGNVIEAKVGALGP
jgi:hypothetical protein